MVELKDKSDLPVSKKGEVLFIQGENISSSMKDLSSGGPVNRPQDMEQGRLSHT